MHQHREVRCFVLVIWIPNRVTKAWKMLVLTVLAPAPWPDCIAGQGLSAGHKMKFNSSCAYLAPRDKVSILSILPSPSVSILNTSAVSRRVLWLPLPGTLIPSLLIKSYLCLPTQPHVPLSLGCIHWQNPSNLKSQADEVPLLWTPIALCETFIAELITCLSPHCCGQGHAYFVFVAPASWLGGNVCCLTEGVLSRRGCDPLSPFLFLFCTFSLCF